MTTLQLGPLALSIGQLLLAVAFVIALLTGWILGRRHGVSIVSDLSDILLIGLLAARIGFVLLYLEFYRDAPLSVIDIRDGGFHFLSGLIGGLLVLSYKLWRHEDARPVLLGAVMVGAGVWGVSAGLIHTIEGQSRTLPELTLEQLNGEPVELAALSGGKPMVINIWASWCPPCVREMPVLESAQTAYPGVLFAFVNHGEGQTTVTRFLDEQELFMDNVLLDRSGVFGRETGHQMLPTTLFYEASGRLVHIHVGELSRATLVRGLGKLD